MRLAARAQNERRHEVQLDPSVPVSALPFLLFELPATLMHMQAKRPISQPVSRHDWQPSPRVAVGRTE